MEKFPTFEQAKRVLTNGVKVLEEVIDEDDASIGFEFTLDKEVEPNNLRDLWTPGSGNDVILQKLIEKGWLMPDATAISHFQMDILENKQQKKIKFKYYKAEDSPFNKGLENSN